MRLSEEKQRGLAEAVEEQEEVLERLRGAQEALAAKEEELVGGGSRAWGRGRQLLAGQLGAAADPGR